jgi:hypothetical protein
MSEPINTKGIVRAEPGRLTIDVEATFAKIIAALSTGPAEELHRLLDHPHGGAWPFAHDPDQPPADDEFALDTGLPPVQLRSVGRGDNAVKSLAMARFGVVYTNLTTGGRTYADRHRVIEALSIIEPIGITAINYPQYTALCLGRIASPTPGLARRIETYTIPTGHYLTTAIGGWGSRQYRAVCRIDRVPSFEELASIPGSRTDRIQAACDQCRGTWTAQRDSLTFQPTSADAKAWDYADATGHDENRIGCPLASCAGRIAFTL